MGLGYGGLFQVQVLSLLLNLTVIRTSDSPDPEETSLHRREEPQLVDCTAAVFLHDGLLHLGAEQLPEGLVASQPSWEDHIRWLLVLTAVVELDFLDHPPDPHVCAVSFMVVERVPVNFDTPEVKF